MNHYHQPDLLPSILNQLEAAGIDLTHLTREHLAGLDEFHLQGAPVSRQLAQRLNLTPESTLLDIGCGIGGPCRMLADEFGCQVTGIDYTEAYIFTAQALTEMVGLADKIRFVEGTALNLPFEPKSFDVVWTQHAQMNIADKAQLYAEIQRVLKKGGQFLYYDIFQGENAGLTFPVPWAEEEEQSHLLRHDSLPDYFPAEQWVQKFTENHTQNAINALEKVKSGPPPKLGLNLLMRDSTKVKLGNLLQALKHGQVEVHAGIYTKRNNT